MFSDPVVGKDFFGREEVLDTLRKRVESFLSGYRQNVALIGHMKLGKTSVLHHFLYTYKNSSILPIYVELKPQPLSSFIDQFVRALLFEYLRRKESIDSMESYDTLIRLAKNFIPKTVAEIEVIQHELKRGSAESAYSRLFELTSCVHKETGAKCVVILDEFHRLGDFGVKNAFQNFGKRIMVQRNTLYLLSSSSFTVSKLILAEKLSLLFGNFERIYLEPFSFEVSTEFIDRRLAPLTMSGDLKKYLIALTDGHPFFLNVICSKARQLGLAAGKQAVDDELLVESLKQLFFDSGGVLNQYFVNLMTKWTGRFKGEHAQILVQLAKNVNKLKELSTAMRRSVKDVSRQLKELMAAELVVKNGVFHHLHDKLFQFWLKFVYEPKEFSLLVDMHSKAENFRVECHRHIGLFLSSAGQAPSDRVAGLLKRFRNELVEFESKGRQLPQFDEVSSPAGAKRGTIIARARKQSWVCSVLETKSTEKDVLELIEQGAALKSNRTKKILVALNGIDHNARLLAKNKKVWTLTLQKLNMLMDFYGQSKIISFKDSTPSEETLSVPREEAVL